MLLHKMYIIAVNLGHNTLPFHYVCLLLEEKLAIQKQAIGFNKNFIVTP